MPASPLASPSATKSVLAEFGLSPKRSLGQHFLVQDDVVRRTLEMAALGPEDVVLEVGPGIGTLTVALLDAACSVVAVERDEALLPVLDRTTGGSARLAVVRGDAVRVPPEDVTAPFGGITALVANLPYEVAATVVLRSFETLPSMRRAVVMVQSEVADRMCAQPGGKDYGAYTVKLALRARATGTFTVPRSAFLPPPRVDSAVISLERREDAGSAETIDAASQAARAAFAQRRKTIRNSISSSLGVPKAQIEASLQAAGVDGGRRAETLSVEEYVVLGSELVKNGHLPCVL